MDQPVSTDAMRSRLRRYVRWFLYIFAFPALISVGIGGQMALRTWLAIHAADLVTATALAPTQDAMRVNMTSHAIYYANFEYIDAAGQTRQARTPDSSNLYTFAPGTKVQVYVNPAQPQVARLPGFWSLWIGPTAMAAPGLIVLLVLFGLYRLFRRFV